MRSASGFALAGLIAASPPVARAAEPAMPAAQSFAALAGIRAESLSSDEMAAIEGKWVDFWGDEYGCPECTIRNEGFTLESPSEGEFASGVALLIHMHFVPDPDTGVWGWRELSYEDTSSSCLGGCAESFRYVYH